MEKRALGRKDGEFVCRLSACHSAVPEGDLCFFLKCIFIFPSGYILIEIHY